MYLAQITDITQTINQLAGKDIAVLLALVLIGLAAFLVVLGVVLLRALRAFVSQARSLSRLAHSLHVKAQAEKQQTDALTNLVATNIKRAEIADKAYQEIFAVGNKVTALTTKIENVGDLGLVVSELRTVGGELLKIAQALEVSARNLEESSAHLKTQD